MGVIVPYYEWIMASFGDSIRDPVADAGAGVGHFADLLARSGLKVIAVEGGKENVDALTNRFSQQRAISVVECDLASCESVLKDAQVNSIVSLDVLEHLPDDVHVLEQFFKALPAGGQIFIKVPALPFLYGPVDLASGHYRRYTKRHLRNSITAAGFHIEKCRYMNLAGVLPYFIKSRILKREKNFSRTFTKKQLDRIARVIPLLRVADFIGFHALGLSLICVARKPR